MSYSLGQDKKLDEDFNQFIANKSNDSVSYFSDLHTVVRLKSEIAKEKYYKALYEDYFINSLEHRRKTFSWQLQSSKITFWVVIGVVICGLGFSAVQFVQVLRTPESFTSNPTEIELSTNNGFKIKSSLIGLLVLSISIAFFYLYLHYVYPIHKMNLDNNVIKLEKSDDNF